MLSRLPTGSKLLLILSGALLPLALIAVFATLQTSRTADLQNRAELRVAAGEAARSLGNELVGDMNALRTALAALEADPQDAASCARTRGVFARGAPAGTRFAIRDRTGALRCGAPVPPGLVVRDDRIGVRLIRERGLVLSVAGSSGAAGASAYFPSTFLSEVARPSGFVRDFSIDLQVRAEALPLRESTIGAFARVERTTVPVGLEGVELEMSSPSAPITSPVLLAMLLPVLMWGAAAGIGWFVVDRLLIRPLRKLRTSVSAYRPGEVFDPPPAGALPAQEIRALADGIGDLSRTISAHEHELAEGLVRQTKLTREVHHRVKNNLQVITSLINFHSRGAVAPEAIAAYSAIQRRVDALAVVHRHHFAELEENRGLVLRSVISELSANLRATATGRSRDFGMLLEIEPFLVSQDTAVAVAFLITELVELAMSVNPAAQLRVSVRTGETAERAVLRVSSPALIESEELRSLLAERYGRVIEGLSRQLRSKLHHEPLVGAYDIAIAVTGRD